MFFNGNEVDDSQFDPLPADTYRVIVDGAAIKPTKNGQGRYVAAKLTILEGQFAKRKIFANFNIDNASEKAQQIGRAQLKRFLKACGHSGVLQSEAELLPAVQNKVLFVETKQYTDSSNSVREDIKEFLDAQGQKIPSSKSTAQAPKSASSAKPVDPLDDLPF